jgi:hypothetical protein
MYDCIVHPQFIIIKVKTRKQITTTLDNNYSLQLCKAALRNSEAPPFRF